MSYWRTFGVKWSLHFLRSRGSPSPKYIQIFLMIRPHSFRFFILSFGRRCSRQHSVIREESDEQYKEKGERETERERETQRNIGEIYSNGPSGETNQVLKLVVINDYFVM